jgi:hypothetical protein
VFLPGAPLRAQTPGVDDQSGDTAQEIFTAALIAEDLASTFYYNGLVRPVVMDPNLAGPGGTATHVEATGNLGNVEYFRAALSEEIQHADLLRSLIGKTSSTTDPIQTFYLPTGTFDTLSAFIGVLNTLENTFIAAYLWLRSSLRRWRRIREAVWLLSAMRAGCLYGAGPGVLCAGGCLDHGSGGGASCAGQGCDESESG